MTTKEKIAVMQAAVDGKPIQYKSLLKSDWNDAGDYKGETLAWDWVQYNYRIKPEPKLRAWKPEEVPVGAIVRCKGEPYRFARQMILWCNDRMACISSIKGVGGFGIDTNFDRLLEIYEHSTDNGKTWLPCGVEE